ncbi:hypothetical protein [Pelomonas sp. BJYL3]|uniref:hypothetical protein n=1 Tax=Pelomonas sp. BJYL3 TaxID=2976697 RepID=UPI0022B373C9|nr:hypothetical protein [Pelomonas sp. BJYL3]
MNPLLWNHSMDCTLRGPKLGLSALATLMLLAAMPVQATVNSGSMGTEPLNPVASQTIELPPDGVLHYSWVNIPAGVTITFKKNKRNTPVYMLVKGNVRIEGMIDVRGEDARDVALYGGGILADDGMPGAGGPGGFDGGRGGSKDDQYRAEVIKGAAGQGPGGGPGGVPTSQFGIPGSAICTPMTSAYTSYPVHGGGGGYAKPAYRYGAQYCGPLTNVGPLFYGKSYGSELLQPLIGGSGGGGGIGGTRFSGVGGGGGGGAILIAADGTITIAGTGSIDASGGDAGGTAGENVGFYGAGGSGGAIRLVATSITGTGKLVADGGCMHANSQRRQGCGSDGTHSSNIWVVGFNGGAVGRIRLEAESYSFSGPTSSSFTKGDPAPIFLTNIPTLRIASIAGVDVPAEPTGVADVDLPAPPSGPVTVVFKTVNVPPGNSVKLRLTPDSGNAVEVESSVVTGSLAEGSASVNVDLRAGASALTAWTSYMVAPPVAVASALSQYANNEKVEQIELAVSLQGEPAAWLHTASGKRFEVSYAQLRAAGFEG